jgi:FMN phosphatase YigB (HAD superfamily)
MRKKYMNKEISQQFVLTEDTPGMLKKIFDPAISTNVETNRYFANVSAILKSSLIENGIELADFSESEMDSALTKKVQTFLSENERGICICLDRFLLDEIENDVKTKDAFARLSICRTVDGEKTSRQQSQPLDQQIQSIRDRFDTISERPILLVDDGVFSGGTVLSIISKLSDIGISTKQCRILGFIGNGETEKLNAQGIQTEIVKSVPNLYDWVDLRDFSVFGGKQYTKSKDGMYSTSIPYLYPWSNGEGASLDMFGDVFEVSKKILNEQASLFTALEEKTGKPVTMGMLAKSGFPFPTDKNFSIKVPMSMRATTYVETQISKIENEQKRNVVIFDMDGTLYELDGKNNGYSGSTLESRVLENACLFIQTREQCSLREAEIIREEGLGNPIGLSAFLGKRYGITREEYFSSVWNINPSGMIGGFDKPVSLINRLSQTETKLILVTSAPSVWQRQICSFLGVTDVFESIYTGEQFKTKSDIFSMLSKRYLPKNITSIGDQFETDIKPAQELGFNTILVNIPSDLGGTL